jgi:hypothetical protein
VSDGQPTVAPGDEPSLTGVTGIRRVAETHRVIRAMLVNALKTHVITDAGREIVKLNVANYYEYYERTFGMRFFDMGTFVRLGTDVETGLRSHYTAICPSSRLAKNPPPRGIFQAFVDPARLLDIYCRDCGYA